jgi:hypothetical protein
MKISDDQVAACLPHVRTAILRLAQCWDAQGRIEEILGQDASNMHETTSDSAYGVDFGSENIDNLIDMSRCREFLEALEEDA